MARNRTYTKVRPVPGGRNIVTETFSQIWEVSPRDAKGNLMLGNNPYSKVHAVSRKYATYGNTDFAPYPNALSGGAENSSLAYHARRRAENQAYARFKGRLHKGGASLGVTIAQYRQSRDMIISRAKALENYNDYIYRTLSRRKWRTLDKQAGNLHLEWIFGWVPLYSDLWASANTVIQWADKSEKVTGVGYGYFDQDDRTFNPYRREQFSGAVTARTTAMVGISNPNLWLANRAGILNPGLVVWDAIPWTWLLGMFVNLQSLIGSITATAGLSLSRETLSFYTVTTGNRVSTNLYPEWHPFWGQTSADWRVEVKTRTPGLAGPSLQFRFPELNWQTAALAASLAVQKMGGLGRFFR